MSDIEVAPLRSEAPWKVQSRLVSEKLLQNSLKMFVDLGLNPREMSRAANLPLEVIEDGIRRLNRSTSARERCADVRPRPVRHSRATELEAQAREIDHRIANSIQIAAAMVKHASRGITDVASARDALASAMSRLTAIARMHRQLSQDLPDSEVDLARFLTPFCSDITQSIGAIIEVQAKDVTLRADKATQVCIILNELAMNAVKHGGHDDESVILSLEAVHSGRDQLRITLRDNGRGLPAGFSLHTQDGLGMTIITSAVEKLDGTLSPLHGSGAGFEITLPLRGEKDGPRSADISAASNSARLELERGRNMHTH
ncbi:sensor histidine kinase [Roseovarius arcticus]|uniref:sensor histidine kinase n=1 Tax=Roseovarius arcticus TaxID=2547404 RepID=UPI001BB221A6|nr:sensor histidine kinase [Roseovarius arcticus]